MEIILVLILFWGLPILIGNEIGKRRNRSGWIYGFLLGWVGVGILALTSYLPSRDEQQLRELEARARLNELGENREMKSFRLSK